jgi:hypothetical protein
MTTIDKDEIARLTEHMAGNGALIIPAVYCIWSQ